jgi:hypothetical protein
VYAYGLSDNVLRWEIDMPALGPGVVGFDKDFVTVVWSDTSVPNMNPEIRVHRYIVCNGFRLTKRDNNFWVNSDNF